MNIREMETDKFTKTVIDAFRSAVNTADATVEKPGCIPMMPLLMLPRPVIPERFWHQIKDGGIKAPQYPIEYSGRTYVKIYSPDGMTSCQKESLCRAFQSGMASVSGCEVTCRSTPK